MEGQDTSDANMVTGNVKESRYVIAEGYLISTVGENMTFCRLISLIFARRRARDVGWCASVTSLAFASTVHVWLFETMCEQVHLHKMPRLWVDYLTFLVKLRLGTRARRTFDRALQALPITQHEKVRHDGRLDACCTRNGSEWRLKL